MRYRILAGALILFLVGVGLIYAPPPEETIEGYLEVMIAEEFDDGRAPEYHYWIVDPLTKAAKRVNFPARFKPRDIVPGSTLLLRGKSRRRAATARMVGRDILDVEEMSIIDGNPKHRNRHTPEPGDASIGEDLSVGLGVKNLIVIIVDYQDCTVPCSNNDMALNVWTDSSKSLEKLYEESSWDKLSIPQDTDPGAPDPDVYRVTIAKDCADPCDYKAHAALADAEADPGGGADLSLYEYKMYVFPQAQACPHSALGSIGPVCATPVNVCRSYTWKCEKGDFTTHEFGHNLGMRHASEDLDDNGVTDPGCTYCDHSCTMGISQDTVWKTFNAPHKEQQDWIDKVVDSTQTLIHPVNTETTYTLSSTNEDPSTAANPQIIKVLIAGNDYYYISYRIDTGFDVELEAEYIDHVSIHRAVEGHGKNTWYVDGLDDSESFVSVPITLTVLMNSHTPTTASVTVTTGEPPASGPSLSIEGVRLSQVKSRCRARLVD